MGPQVLQCVVPTLVGGAGEVARAGVFAVDGSGLLPVAVPLDLFEPSQQCLPLDPVDRRAGGRQPVLVAGEAEGGAAIPVCGARAVLVDQ